MRENYRGLVLPAASGMLIAVAALLALGPAGRARRAGGRRHARARGSATALMYVLGVAVLGLVDDLLGGRRAGRRRRPTPDAPRGLARPRAGRRARGLQHRHAEGGRRARPRAVRARRARAARAGEYLVGGRRAGARARNLFNLLDLRPGRARQGVRRARRRADARLLGHRRRCRRSASSSARRWCCCRTTCASGRCSATPARTCSARVAGLWLVLALGTDGRGGRARRARC